MERESLLAILAMLLGGAVLQVFALWPSMASLDASPAELERLRWIGIWAPVVPMLVVVAGLLGWALQESDPVRDPLDPGVLLAIWAPFGLVFLRAAVRAARALVSRPADRGVSTIGLIQPHIVFSPLFARQLDVVVIRAALAHERAHALHRDPLRIWIAQLATDLQWPWPAAKRRFDAWLDALELARDDEARAGGTDGADLAAAVLASVRFLSRQPPDEYARWDGTRLAHTRLTGNSPALRVRVSRLLAPLPEHCCERPGNPGLLDRAGYLLIPLLTAAVVLGLLCGERIVQPLLAATL